MDTFNSKVKTTEQLVKKIEELEDRNAELTEEVDQLSGIREALEEKVSAYRYRLKELTNQLESIDISPFSHQEPYHNRDELERRRLILQRPRSPVTGTDSINAEANKEESHIEEKYERLLEQYMCERERNEQLFDYLFSKEKNARLDLFVMEDAADTLLEATTLSRKIIEQAEMKVRMLETNMKK